MCKNNEQTKERELLFLRDFLSYQAWMENSTHAGYYRVKIKEGSLYKSWDPMLQTLYTCMSPLTNAGAILSNLSLTI